MPENERDDIEPSPGTTVSKEDLQKLIGLEITAAEFQEDGITIMIEFDHRFRVMVDGFFEWIPFN